jgi:Putative zinc-finger
MMTNTPQHEESWLLLPWLANGRLSHAQRAQVEEHVRECAQCAEEVARQELIRSALTEPERVTYAPGPSLRKLLDRIDGHVPAVRGAAAAPVAQLPVRAASAWRPPGLAWAASFVMVAGLSALAPTAYRWSQPVYVTHTANAVANPDVVHIAFVPSLSVAEAGELLRSAGARVVEGPDSTGILGITAASLPAQQSSSESRRAVRELALRLRADARVRWVEPVWPPVSAPAQERRTGPP